jgi:signal transduction histidine kinase
MGEASRLRETGDTAAAQGIEDVVLTMRRTVDRELNRTRRLAGVGIVESNVLQTVTGIIAVLHKTPNGHRIEWKIDIAEDLLVALDPNDLAEALGAVLENAARFATSVVHVTADEGQYVTIRDDGCGIPAEQREGMLARFARLDEHGSGMGLAIASEIMRAAGGDIILSDAHPGLCVDLHFNGGRASS